MVPPWEPPETEVVPGSSPGGGEVVYQGVHTQDDPFLYLRLSQIIWLLSLHGCASQTDEIRLHRETFSQTVRQPVAKGSLISLIRQPVAGQQQPIAHPEAQT
eukprot:668738-Pelagomonas_calceolata.AAC.3